MIRVLITLFLLCASASPAAYAEEPSLEIETNEVNTIPGQSISLRLTVLTPTNLLQPPDWPDFDMPNLMVRVASTGPAISKINGATWSGVSRRYLITPMVPGEFILSASDLKVNWADPETRAPIETTLQMKPVTIIGVIPAQARDLAPFIAAKSIKLDVQLEGDPAKMSAGDSVIYTVQADIEGTSPIFLPSLLTQEATEGLRSYPDEPLLEEKPGDRGQIGGTRTEKMTYVAEGGGQGQTQGVTLRWYDLDTGKIETAHADGFDYFIDAPPVQKKDPPNWRIIILAIVMGFIAIALTFMILRRAFIWLRIWRQDVKAKRLASEHHAWSELRDVIRRRDLSHLGAALDKWSKRLPSSDIRSDPKLTSALTKIGAARYSRVTSAGNNDGWRELAQVLSKLRNTCLRPPVENALPALNPTQIALIKQFPTVNER